MVGNSVRVLDATWLLPNSGRDPRAEFAARHIPGAMFFDIEKYSDKSSPMPHMLPPADQFTRDMRADLSLCSTDHIVCYDTAPQVFSAARCYWTFRIFGHARVSLLDGGLAKWVREDRRVTGTPTDLPPAADADFSAVLDEARVRSHAQMLELAAAPAPSAQIIDARPAGRFNMTAPEPRSDIKSGRIPGSMNVPASLCSKPDGTLKSGRELRALFEERGVDLARPMVSSCGSGVTACILMLAQQEAGAADANVALYDGSWSEYGRGPASSIDSTKRGD
ncbi:MAG: hypothetical protein SGCHY_001640 [Lobulomycetales sp.]